MMQLLWGGIFFLFFFFVTHESKPVNRVYHYPHTFLDVFKRDGVSNRVDIENRTRNTLQIDFHWISEEEFSLWGQWNDFKGQF